MIALQSKVCVCVGLERRAQAKAGQQMRIFELGEWRDSISVSKVSNSYPKMVQGGTTTEDQLLVVFVSTIVSSAFCQVRVATPESVPAKSPLAICRFSCSWRTD